MRVARKTDKALIEGIVTHPAVWPHVSEDTTPFFDASPYLDHPNLALIVEGGCFLLRWHGFGRVEAHTNFLPTMRGRGALEQAREAMAYTFLATACHFLVTRVPQNNPAADWFTRAMGFRLRFERPDAWLKDGRKNAVRYYELDVDDWIMQGRCVAAGRDFHEKLQQRLPAHRSHGEDHAHDCYVGALAQMIRAGSAEKGVFIYNRWARLAGYQEISIVSTDPLKIDIRDAILTIENGDFAVEEN